MRRTSFPLALGMSLLLLGLACGRLHVAGPMAVFPVSAIWGTRIDDGLDGPLATDGTHVFATTRNGTLFAFDALTGVLLWRSAERAGFLAEGDGVLILRQTDGTVLRLEPGNGAARWKTASGVGGGIPAIVDGDAVFVAGDGAAALDIETGRVRWRTTDRPRSTSPPAATPTWLFTGEADGTLRCRDRKTGASLWTAATGQPILAPPVIDDRGRVLLGTTARAFLALDSKRQGERIWRWKLGADVQIPPTLLADRVLVASFEDVLWAITRKNGHVAWHVPLPSRPLSAPLVSGATVIIACQESDIVGFEIATGKKAGSIKMPSEIKAPPVLGDGRFFVGLRDRSVVAYRYAGAAPPPTPTPAASPSSSPSASPSPSPSSPGPSPSPSVSPVPSPTPPAK